MTSSEMEAFLAIVKTGNMTAAANSLYLTQPALSRRILSLEKELGCTLFTRGKGIRNVELTPQGEYLLSLSEKWQQLFKETSAMTDLKYHEPFFISSIGSISFYLLPNVFHRFMNEHPHIPLSFYGCHSMEAYSYVADRRVDFALVSDPMFHPQVITTPVFSEKMVFISTHPCPDTLSPSELNPEKEIRLPWYPNFDAWHDYWFGKNAPCRVYLDQMNLLESFLMDDCWAIVPVSVKEKLAAGHPIYSAELKEGPVDHIIYSLHRTGNKEDFIQLFLSYLEDELKGIPGITFHHVSVS